MRAYRMVAWEKPPELVEVDVPVPGPGELLVKVAGNGLCHSDMTMQALPGELGEAIGWHMPFTLGHEVGGWVAEVGRGVDGLAEGDPVALVSPHSCGRCWYCVRGQENNCEEGLAGRGYGRDGGLADYVLVGSAREVVKLGSLDPHEAGPLTDAGATTYHGVKRVLPKLEDGSTAVVIGAGGLGSFAIQFLKGLTDASVIAVDPNPSRRMIAGELGADHVLDGVDPTTAGAVRELTAGLGADVVLDIVGIDHTISAGLQMLRKAGSFALIGVGGGTLTKPWHGNVPFDVEVFSYQGSSIADVRETIELADRGIVRSEIDRFPLERVVDAYAAMEAGTLRGRAVVIPFD